jgi:ferric-dicitrate binding protein FerR (iron transport regulator)
MEGNITAEERTQLSEAAETYSIKEWEEILEPLAQTTTPDQNFNIQDWEKEIQYILSQPAIQPAPVIPLYRKKIFKWIAAACIVLAVGVLANVWWNSKGTGDKTQVAKTQDIPAPSNTRAVITLADGSKVYLDSVNSGTIAQQNNVNIVKNSNGGISYLSPAGGGDLNESPYNIRPGVDYNTLCNPRGSNVIDMTLSDGSHVWLNAGSSITYPVAFIGKERKITMDGEAYFEVAHDASKPFIVSKGETSVQVLGTHFNVNAYDDEDALRVTLLEGSVNVSNNAGSVKIKPGQQAELTRNSQPITRNSVDLDAVMAWKDGRFQFEGEGIESVMRQIARWYDVNIVYETKPKDHFRGAIPRNVEASKVFQMLETMGVVKFEIKGKTVIVKSPQ